MRNSSCTVRTSHTGLAIRVDESNNFIKKPEKAIDDSDSERQQHDFLFKMPHHMMLSPPIPHILPPPPPARNFYCDTAEGVPILRKKMMPDI